MAGRSITLNKDILVPLGTLITAVTLAVGIVRYSDSADAAVKTTLAESHAQNQAIIDRVTKLETRADKADERWAQVIQHLSAIEQALKINPNTIAGH